MLLFGLSMYETDGTEADSIKSGGELDRCPA